MVDRSPELDQLATALSAAQAEFSAIPKEQDNQFYSSKYADLASVVTAAAPIITKHGLSVTQWIGSNGAGDTLTTYLLHSSGQFIAGEAPLHLVNSKGEPWVAPQGQGSAVTYARRYAYMAALGLVAEEDDDGNAASQPPPAGGAPATQAPPPSGGAPPAQASAVETVTDKQAKMLYARSRHLQRLDLDKMLMAVGARNLDDVPRNRVDELLQMFETGHAPAPPPDVPIDTEGLPDPQEPPPDWTPGEPTPDDDIPF
jgi:hypothetical protein